MTTVARLLEGKGHDLWTVTPDSSVYDAIALMSERNVGALLVMQDQLLSGIVSERDYARKVILQSKSSRDTPVGDIMSSPVVSIGPDQSVEDCMKLMTEKRIRHLPVVQDDRVIGMISIGDVVRSLISAQKDLIGHLQSYITGG